MSTAGPQTVKWALFSLQGRIRRSTFIWSSLLLIALIWVALSQVAFAETDSGQQIFWSFAFFGAIAMSLYCLIALAVKRIHDVGYSGWWVMLGFITTLYILGFIFLCFWAGDEDENRYGPPPVRASH